MDRVHVLLMTTTTVASSCSLPFSGVLKFLCQHAELAILDEAQQGLDATDAWIFTLCAAKALILLIGDQAQPAGASNVLLLQRLLQTMLQVKPGLHAPQMKVSDPASYLQALRLCDEAGRLVEPGNHGALLGHLIQNHSIEFSTSASSLLGFDEPGALLLPVSARVCCLVVLCSADQSQAVPVDKENANFCPPISGCRHSRIPKHP